MIFVHVRETTRRGELDMHARILDALAQTRNARGYVSQMDVAYTAKVSAETARFVLKELVRKGVVVQVGSDSFRLA